MKKASVDVEDLLDGTIIAYACVLFQSARNPSLIVRARANIAASLYISASCECNQVLNGTERARSY